MRSDYKMAIRAGLASLLSVAVSKQLGFPQPAFTAVVAAVVVTDLDPKQTRRLSVQRLAGIALGAVVGAGFDWLLSTNIFMMAAAIAVAMALCAALNMREGM